MSGTGSVIHSTREVQMTLATSKHKRSFVSSYIPEEADTYIEELSWIPWEATAGRWYTFQTN